MRLIPAAAAAAALLASAPVAAQSTAEPATDCRLTPREVVTEFMTEFYIRKNVRAAFETWVDPGYVQHNPMAPTGRDAAIGFLEPFFANNPAMRYEIHRIIADGNLVAVHAHGQMNADDRGMAVIDILRVDGCKVMEHWDVLQPVPANPANSNTMF